MDINRKLCFSIFGPIDSVQRQKTALQRAFLIIVTVLSLTYQFSDAQDISIEFVETPVIYPVGQFGESEGAFAPFTKSLNKDSISQIIQNELKKYPKGVLEIMARLSKVILSDTMVVIDAKGEFTKYALGTFLVPLEDGNIVFLDATQRLLPAILHHEISSIFIFELAVRDSVFRDRTDKIFKFFRQSTEYHYKDEDVYKEIKMNDNWPRNRNNFSVLGNSGYALMDAENDFNEIANCLFSPTLLRANGALLIDPKLKLWDFLDEAKLGEYAIYKKVMLVIDYYHAIDPLFNEAYFRNLEK